jgi:hypothetical protein
LDAAANVPGAIYSAVQKPVADTANKLRQKFWENKGRITKTAGIEGAANAGADIGEQVILDDAGVKGVDWGRAGMQGAFGAAFGAGFDAMQVAGGGNSKRKNYVEAEKKAEPQTDKLNTEKTDTREVDDVLDALLKEEELKTSEAKAKSPKVEVDIPQAKIEPKVETVTVSNQLPSKVEVAESNPEPVVDVIETPKTEEPKAIKPDDNSTGIGQNEMLPNEPTVVSKPDEPYSELIKRMEKQEKKDNNLSGKVKKTNRLKEKFKKEVRADDEINKIEETDEIDGIFEGYKDAVKPQDEIKAEKAEKADDDLDVGKDEESNIEAYNKVTENALPLAKEKAQSNPEPFITVEVKNNNRQKVKRHFVDVEAIEVVQTPKIEGKKIVKDKSGNPIMVTKYKINGKNRDPKQLLEDYTFEVEMPDGSAKTYMAITAKLPNTVASKSDAYIEGTIGEEGDVSDLSPVNDYLPDDAPAKITRKGESSCND